MTGFLETLAGASADQALFVDDVRLITAGDIRAAARRALEWLGPGNEQVFIHTESAAMLCAGLLAGAVARRPVAVLPHARPAYLEEIGAVASRLLTDAGKNAPLALTPGDGSEVIVGREADVIFFTSGSTGAPKQVARKISQLNAEACHWAGAFGGLIDHVAGTVSHQHMYGITFRVFLPVAAGWRAADRQDLIWETFAAKFTPRTLAVTSPAHLARIPNDLTLPNGAPAIVLSAGQLLPLPAVVGAAAVFGKPPLEIYGSTEVGAVARRQRSDDLEPWSPLPGMKFSLDLDGAVAVSSPFLGNEVHRMGDLAKVLPDGRFHLLGRVDGVLKIEGKRISPTRVEQALRSLPEVHDAAVAGLEGVSGAALGAVVVLDAAFGSSLGRLGSFRVSRDLRRKLAPALEPAELPKRWRFVGRIPVNTQGKRSASAMAKLFEASMLLPSLGAKLEEFDEVAAKVAFRLAPDLPWFEGHFPGQPILAGLAQTDIAVRLGEEIWGFLPTNFQLTRLKFRRILQPGDDVVLHLSRDIARGRLGFVFISNGVAASEGVLGA